MKSYLNVNSKVTRRGFYLSIFRLILFYVVARIGKKNAVEKVRDKNKKKSRFVIIFTSINMRMRENKRRFERKWEKMRALRIIVIIVCCVIYIIIIYNTYNYNIYIIAMKILQHSLSLKNK